MEKILPADEGDMGSIPDAGRSHMPQNSYACVPQLLSLCSRAQEPKLLKSTRPRAHAPWQKKPGQREACTPQLENSAPRPASPQWELSPCNNKHPAQLNINK